MDDIVTQLKAENDELRERVRQLCDLLSPPDFVPPLEWGLTATEARIFAHLKSREQAFKETIHAAAYGHMAGETPELNVVESHISRLKRKIAKQGYQIIARRFEGYRLVRQEVRHG
jgi:two-component system cell cycle response regulator CtrA